MDVAVLPTFPSVLAFMTYIDYDLLVIEDCIVKVFNYSSNDKFMFSFEK